MSQGKPSVASFQQPRRRAWLMAVLGALLLQSLFPSGYMPTSLKEGWVAMLCPQGLPAAFIEQLARVQQQTHGPADVQARQHSHAHGYHQGHGSAGEAEFPAGQGDEHVGGHDAVGHCQLGSALHQSADVASTSSVIAGGALQLPPSVADRFWVATAHTCYARSRAPPLS